MIIDLELLEEFGAFKKSLVFWYQMAAVAACRRLGKIGTNFPLPLTGFGGFGIGASKFSPYISGSTHYSQFIKSKGKQLFLVDTLALVIYLPFHFPFMFLISMF